MRRHSFWLVQYIHTTVYTMSYEDYCRSYERWLDIRDELEEEEELDAWEDAVENNCMCVYETGKGHHRYRAWDWVAPQVLCDWHKSQAAWRARENKRQMEAAGIELPAGYVWPTSCPPNVAEDHPWHDELLYVRARLFVLEGAKLGLQLRLKLISEIFEFMADPANIELLRSNVKLRATVVAKVSEFRADARAAPMKGILDRLEAALAAIKS
jgi:hypothetical protein